MANQSIFQALYGVVLILILGLCFAGDAHAAVTCETEEDAAISLSDSLSSPSITRTFAKTMMAYQESTSGKIFVKFASVENNSLTTGAEFEVANGELLGSAQDTTQGIVYYRATAEGAVLAKLIDADTKVIRDSPLFVMTYNDSMDGFGSFYSSSKKFLVWGTSISLDRYAVKRQSKLFPESDPFEPVISLNATTGYILSVGMDPEETLLFVINRTGEIWTAAYASGVRETFSNKHPMGLIKPITNLAPNSTVEAVASNAEDTYMLLTSQVRDGQKFLQMQVTNVRGLIWTDPLEVGAFTPSVWSSTSVKLLWASQWIVILGTEPKLQWLQIGPAFPFEFDWRAAFKENNFFDFVATNASSIDILVTRGRFLTVIGEKSIPGTDRTKLSALYCSPLSSSAENLARLSSWSVWLTALLLLLQLLTK